MVHRVFRIMDDDGSKSLNFDEFKKGLQDYKVSVSDAVSFGLLFYLLYHWHSQGSISVPFTGMMLY